jgi:hypothetical protein
MVMVLRSSRIGYMLSSWQTYSFLFTETGLHGWSCEHILQQVIYDKITNIQDFAIEIATLADIKGSQAKVAQVRQGDIVIAAHMNTEGKYSHLRIYIFISGASFILPKAV